MVAQRTLRRSMRGIPGQLTPSRSRSVLLRLRYVARGYSIGHSLSCVERGARIRSRSRATVAGAQSLTANRNVPMRRTTFGFFARWSQKISRCHRTSNSGICSRLLITGFDPVRSAFLATRTAVRLSSHQALGRASCPRKGTTVLPESLLGFAGTL